MVRVDANLAAAYVGLGGPDCRKKPAPTETLTPPPSLAIEKQSHRTMRRFFYIELATSRHIMDTSLWQSSELELTKAGSRSSSA